MPENEQGRPGEGSGPAESAPDCEDSALPPIVQESELPPFGALRIFRGDQLARLNAGPVVTLPFLGRAGYVPKGSATLIASYPKTGKTTLLAVLVDEWVRDGNRVLIMSEETPRIWAHRIPTDAAEIWARVRIIDALGSHRESLLNHAAESPENIVCIDTLRNVLALEDETDNSKVALAVNPVIAKMRDRKKTLICFAHHVKGGGGFGRAIAGGHALFACFDTAIEIDRVPGVPCRRQVTGTGHLIEPEALLYEKTEQGGLVVIGAAASVARVEVARRIKDDVMSAGQSDKWFTRSEIRDALDDPKPGATVINNALSDLENDGDVVRERRSGSFVYQLSPIEPPGENINRDPLPDDLLSPPGSKGENNSEFDPLELLAIGQNPDPVTAPISDLPTPARGGGRSNAGVDPSPDDEVETAGPEILTWDALVKLNTPINKQSDHGSG